MFKLAPNLTLPPSAPTKTYAFLGTRGSGKTYAAGKAVETFLAADVQVVIVDPVGVWWGLRLGADSTRSGAFDIPIFGGSHGDIPLEPTSGALCAQLAAERRLSVVLDVSEFPSEAAQHRFVTDFARDLFRLKQRNRSPVHVVFEEAHEFLPQHVDGGAAPMVGAVKRLWKLGRNFGIGGSLISQRAAEVNKGALNLTEILFTGKLKGPQDRKAIAGWAVDQDRENGPLRSLPTLKEGQLIAWLEDGAVEIRVFPKRTFDASKTPDHAENAPRLPAIAIDDVRAAMAATIEEVKANDPKALRAEVAKLREQLEGATAGDMAGSAEVERLRDAVSTLRSGMAFADDFARDVKAERQRTSRLLGALERAFEDYTGRPVTLGCGGPIVDAGEPPWTPPAPISATEAARLMQHRPAPAARPRVAAGDADLPVACRRILTALAQCGPRLTRRKLSILTGYPPGGSSLRNNFSKLRLAGQIRDVGEDVEITELGRTALGAYDPLPTGRALIDYWMRELPEAAAKILTVVVGAHPAPVTRAKLAHVTGYPPGGSSIRNNLSKLRGLELVVDVGDDIKAADELFGGA